MTCWKGARKEWREGRSKDFITSPGYKIKKLRANFKEKGNEHLPSNHLFKMEKRLSITLALLAACALVKGGTKFFSDRRLPGNEEAIPQDAETWNARRILINRVRIHNGKGQPLFV